MWGLHPKCELTELLTKLLNWRESMLVYDLVGGITNDRDILCQQFSGKPSAHDQRIHPMPRCYWIPHSCVSSVENYGY